MNVEALKALLSAEGYELRFHRNEWTECLLVGGDGETWHGRGLCESTALLDAVTLAFPSSLARRWLHEAVERKAATEPVAGNVASSSPEPSAFPMAPRPAVGHRVAVRSSTPHLVSRREAPIRLDLAGSVEALRLLDDRIRDSREELGLCAPDRQRLTILAWICEARAHTDLFPEDARIREEVAVVSRRLTEIGKAFWPGSVTALQLQMQPRELPKHLLGGFARTWTRAAELAERALHGLEHGDDRRGLDEYGWADLPFTHPVATHPEGVLGDLTQDVEAHGGSIERYAEPKDPMQRPSPERFRSWVRTLRWLRGAPVDPDRWARIAGRLRWWGGRRDAGVSDIARELDPAYSPPQPWVELLEQIQPAENDAPQLPRSVEELRGRCEGLKIVVVSHRRDPDRRGRLESALVGSSLDWRVSEPSRLRELETAICEGTFDVVFGALGFQAPTADRLLATACRRADTPYLRVNRGRPSVCVRALLRRFEELPA